MQKEIKIPSVKNKQTIIIFEGHDKAGKTTILNSLSRQQQLPIFKLQRDKKWFDPYVVSKYGDEMLLQFLEQTKTSVILDRCFPSQYAYSKVYNRAFDKELLFEYDKRYSDLNTFIIYCYKNKKAYVKDEIIDISKYPKITRQFNVFFKKSKCKVLKLNTTNQNLVKQLDRINSFIFHEHRNI